MNLNVGPSPPADDSIPGPESPVRTCNCWSSLIRLIKRCRAATAAASPQQQPPESAITPQQDGIDGLPRPNLTEALTLANVIVHEWERMVACFQARSHIGLATLSFLADAVGHVIGLLEPVVNGLSAPAGEAGPAGAGPKPAAYLGELKLSDEEATIVGREAIQDAVIRLGALMEDIEQEARRIMLEGTDVDAANKPLQDQMIRDLISRLYRLLGKVDGS